MAQIVVRRLAVWQAQIRFPAMEIPLLSSSNEENGVGLNDFDLYVMYKIQKIIKSPNI